MKGDPRDALLFEPVGNHTSIAAAAVTTLTPPAGASKLLIQAVNMNVRFTLDGVDPTVATGFQLQMGEIVWIPMGQDNIVKVLREAAGGTVEYQWGKD